MDEAQSGSTAEPAELEHSKWSGARRSGLSSAIEIVKVLVLTLGIFLVIQNFIAQPFQVMQGSMERTFFENDYVLVDRLTPRWDDYSTGDIVIFRAPATRDTLGTPFIKRVIGVAGDTVEVRDDGLVWVNGVVLDEPYIYRDDAGNAEPTEASDQTRWVVPAGQLFVMGDHRRRSDDSRVFGPILVSSVIGREVLRYWPLTPKP